MLLKELKTYLGKLNLSQPKLEILAHTRQNYIGLKAVTDGLSIFALRDSKYISQTRSINGIITLSLRVVF